ncbi:MAG: hypothetical protein MI921_07660 [Cytophagales bacterium]|nr:hypothetical protein [Cytophagales bacterium]
MKFPQFIRVPKYKRFHITPRYYDPVKEDIEMRTQKIKNELYNSKLGNYRSHISGSFERKVTRDSNTGFLRLIIFLVIIGSLGGYIYFGKDFLYIFFLLIPVYVYFRLKGGTKRR